MKQCKLCREVKPTSEYHKNSLNKDGLENRCKSCRKQDARAKYSQDPFVTLARIKKAECKKKGIPFNLDAAYLRGLWTGVCPISGEQISIGNEGNGSYISAHLDRFDPDKGYVKGNIEYISGRMNRIKYNATILELEQLLRWMKHRQEGATTIP